MRAMSSLTLPSSSWVRAPSWTVRVPSSIPEAPLMPTRATTRQAALTAPNARASLTPIEMDLMRDMGEFGLRRLGGGPCPHAHRRPAPLLEEPGVVDTTV